MKVSVEKLVLMVLALLVTGCAGSQSGSPPAPSATVLEVDRTGRGVGVADRDDALRRAPTEPHRDAAIRAAMDSAGVPGVAVAYLADCRVEQVATYGVANAVTGEPVTERTLFEAASLSKPVFAYLLMEMVDDGALDLDAPIAALLDYPRITDTARYAAITPRTAVSHTIGFPNWAGAPRNWDRTDSLLFAFDPGVAFRYSGEGYQLTQLYVEKLAGRSLEALFRGSLDAVMPASVFGGTQAEGIVAATGHDRSGSVDGGRAIGDWPRANAAYTLRTTVEDYARFIGRVCSGDELSEAAHSEMLRQHMRLIGDEQGADPDEVEAEIGWALGWGIQTTAEGTIYFHWGDNGPFKAFTAFDPVTRRGVVYFANGTNGLALMELIAAPIVGSVRPISVWLDY